MTSRGVICFFLSVVVMGVEGKAPPGCNKYSCVYNPPYITISASGDAYPACSCFSPKQTVTFQGGTNFAALFDSNHPFDNNHFLFNQGSDHETIRQDAPPGEHVYASCDPPHCNDPKLIVKPVNVLIPSSPDISFTRQPRGKPSESRPETITNNGGAPITILVAVAGRDTGDFSTDHGCDKTLDVSGPAASCTFNVTFTPMKTGDRQGLIQIANKVTNAVLLTIPVSGKGTKP